MKPGKNKTDHTRDDDIFESSDEDIDVTDNDLSEEEEEESNFSFGTECVVDPDDRNKKYWMPLCPDSCKPAVGKKFKSTDEGESFYREYAALVGFDVRSSTTHKFVRSDVVKLKYFVCTREGFKNSTNSTGQRKTTSNRIGCEAKITLKSLGVCDYVVDKFIEKHNHDMMPNKAKHFLKSNRKLDIGHKKFMLSCAKANLGPIRSYKLLKEIVGGYGNMRAMPTDFKNFKRDLMSNITAADAQMVINRFLKKKEQCNAFYFEYHVNDEQQLTRLFWADPISRRNYAAFGDVVSFDSTFNTNRYCMVFAPFTGIDNHKKSVTFGAGLVMKEDVQSYEWLFENFIKAMGHAPKIIVTDQDPAMKVAIENVLPQTRHRLCMWHIMEKVSKKVGVKKINSPNFRKKLGKLVWGDKQSISGFEEGWKSFVAEEDLEDNRWFQDIYKIRDFWIPAYFMDIVLGGLVRTTSISESQNSFMGAYSNRNFSLVELLMQFESAMETQRHHQLRNDVDSDTRTHVLKTPLFIERHASEVYTLKLFTLVQEEISAACYFCAVTNETPGEWTVAYTVKEGQCDYYEVERTVCGNFTTCSCGMFNKIGLPCRHIFTALKCFGLDRIPECLILDRWRKGALKKVKCGMAKDVWEQSVLIEEKQSMMNELWSVIYSCVGLVEDDRNKIIELLNTLKNMKEKYSAPDDNAVRDEEIRDTMVEGFAGISTPNDVVIKPPGQAKNKGSGRRLIGGKEKAMKEMNKGKRKCKKCNKYAGHDSRNCKENL